MGIKLANNAFGTLAAGIASDATSITLTTGHGDRFPFLGAGDYFYATLIDTSNNLEIVKCTARATDVLTVTRAQEGTTARAYSAGDRIEIRLTAQTFSDIVDVTAFAKKDGSNATGTWPVSVSGNAATATNAEKLGGESYTAYVRSLGAALYTSSGTWTVPAGVTAVEVEVVGGGGAGGNTTTGGSGPNSYYKYGGTGGGGAWITAFVSELTPGAAITITVGLGGAGISSNGESGRTSSFGGYVTCTGGAGGTGGASGGSCGAIGTASVSATAVAIGLQYERASKSSTTSTAKAYTPLSGYAAGAGGGVSTTSGYGGVSGKILIKW